jgi:hypothetical protein
MNLIINSSDEMILINEFEIIESALLNRPQLWAHSNLGDFPFRTALPRLETKHFRTQLMVPSRRV